MEWSLGAWQLVLSGPSAWLERMTKKAGFTLGIDRRSDRPECRVSVLPTGHSYEIIDTSRSMKIEPFFTRRILRTTPGYSIRLALTLTRAIFTCRATRGPGDSVTLACSTMAQSTPPVLLLSVQTHAHAGSAAPLSIGSVSGPPS